MDHNIYQHIIRTTMKIWKWNVSSRQGLSKQLCALHIQRRCWDTGQCPAFSHFSKSSMLLTCCFLTAPALPLLQSAEWEPFSLQLVLVFRAKWQKQQVLCDTGFRVSSAKWHRGEPRWERPPQNRLLWTRRAVVLYGKFERIYDFIIMHGSPVWLHLISTVYE